MFDYQSVLYLLLFVVCVCFKNIGFNVVITAVLIAVTITVTMTMTMTPTIYIATAYRHLLVWGNNYPLPNYFRVPRVPGF